jgi:peptide/nickel transport system substrate-binding protein
MHRLGIMAVAGPLLIGLFTMQPALAQKSGGVLKISFFDNPASMSLHEEATGAALRPMMGVFNNLVMYDQHVAQNSPDRIIPDLATSWAWSEDGKELTFQLHQGVKWHDGTPFTAADVKCTWDLLLGIGSEKLRVNPRKTWYLNVDRVTTNGDYEVTFHLKRPQSALLSLQPSGLRIVTATAEPDRCADRDRLVAQAMALLEQDDRFGAQRAGSDPRSAG